MAATYKAYKAVDISGYQGSIDFAAMKKSGIRAVIVRAGVSRSVDSRLCRNLSGASSAGILVGAYYCPYVLTHNGVTNSALKKDAVLCAKTAVGWLDGFRLDLPLFVDWEYAQDEHFAKNSGMNLTVSGRTLFVREVAEQIRKRGYTPGIYTNPDYLMNKFTAGSLGGYPLFLAQWATHGSAVSAASVPQRYGMPMLWQYDYGRVSGCAGDIDLDYYFVKQ